MIDVGVGMEWRRRKPKTLGATCHGRIIDRLHVDSVLVQKDIGSLFALGRIADQHRNDMRNRRHHRDSGFGETAFQGLGTFLVRVTEFVVFLQLTNAGKRRGGNPRRHGGRKDEAVAIRPDEVAKRCGPGDVAADDAKRLGQGALDDR